MDFISDRLGSWMTFEPLIGFLMIITAVILFIITFNKNKEKPDKFWQWCVQLCKALGVAVLFLGILWAFRAILNDNTITFSQTHGRVSEVNYQSVRNIWGGPHVQRELEVSHSIERLVQEEIPREDPEKPPLYRNIKETVTIPQNSIIGFKGKAALSLNKRQKGSAFYSGFENHLSMEYEIMNDSGYTTKAFFYLPRSTNLVLIEDFEILENTGNISERLRFNYDSVSWTKEMSPGEKLTLSISYKTRGLDFFYYQIPSPREIRNFSLELIVDKLPFKDINYPEGCIPPKKENITPTEDGKGSVLLWNFHQTVTTAGMGISLSQPEQPGVRVSSVLNNSINGLMMLIIAMSLTLLVFNVSVNLIELSLLSGIHSLLFITMSSLSDFFLGFWGTLIIGAALTMGLSILLFMRKGTITLRICLWSLVGFFTIVYPLLSLTSEYQTNLNGVVVMGLIIYLFLITFFSRIKKHEQEG